MRRACPQLLVVFTLNYRQSRVGVFYASDQTQSRQAVSNQLEAETSGDSPRLLPTELRLQSEMARRSPHSHHCALCGSCNGEWNGRLKKCSACRRVTYCSRRCQRVHWSLHKMLCKQETMHLFWQHLACSTSPRLHNCAVVGLVLLIGALTSFLVCQLLLPAVGSHSRSQLSDWPRL